MFVKHDKEQSGVFKSIMAAHAILLLHVFLIAGIGLLVLFFGGFIRYMGWIFLVGAGVILALGYRFYRRMKQEGKTVAEMMRPSLLQGKSVELSVMDGLISFKVGESRDRKQIDAPPGKPRALLEDPHSKPMEELAELVRLLESGLITREEYDQAKKSFFRP
ncbi:MAG: hypothetical protein JRI76_09165 [Deltaproteobacteria bacterium]|nr:hypothetical protein [Deltaproteobacteria bacterium]MBW2042188.1 hypothetical protein [Deltaproteobacteria bacterium]MBW2133048.1 hypothetical protein [Deltaproteobacteria bacterium]